MDSSYFGEANINIGNERSGGGGRKGKSSKSSGSSNSSDKPKQPQRGLGVAQLEKIRLQSQMPWSPSHHYSNLNHQDDMRIETGYSSSSSSFTYSSPSSNSAYAFHAHHQPIMMGLSHELDGDSHPSTNARWNIGNAGLETQHFIQPTISSPIFFNQNVEGSMDTKKKKERRHSTGSNNQNSESSGSHELDLELRLSI